MKRIIKFRVWNGEQMVSPDYIDRKGTAWWKEHSIPTTSDDIMQFSGLLDKNGKEIYEGDIIKYYQPYSKTTHTHLVKWDEKFAGFGLFENGNEWCKESDWVKIQDIEIIGNAFETPEILI